MPEKSSRILRTGEFVAATSTSNPLKWGVPHPPVSFPTITLAQGPMGMNTILSGSPASALAVSTTWPNSFLSRTFLPSESSSDLKSFSDKWHIDYCFKEIWRHFALASRPLG